MAWSESRLRRRRAGGEKRVFKIASVDRQFSIASENRLFSGPSANIILKKGNFNF